jgi:hypothetical protein
VVVLALTASGTHAQGQTLDRLRAAAGGLDSAQSLRRLEVRSDSLAFEWRRANALAAMVDSVDRAPGAAGSDTIRVGALRIITDRSALPLREAAIRAWPAIDSLYGLDAELLQRRPLVVAAYDPDTTVPRPLRRGAVQIPWDLDVASLTWILLANVPIARGDSALEHWLGRTVRPTVVLDRELAAVYVRLVTAPSQAARSCFSGAIASCRDAVGLVSAPDLVLRWYPSPAERRALVARTFSPYVQGAERSRLQACVDGNDTACQEALRALPFDAVPRPLGLDARETLLHLALRLGGREAYHRLMAAADQPMADRLASAAGVTTDSLLTRWRAAVLAARPAPLALPSSGVWMGLGWALFFAACGLRSSRWRAS